MAFVALFLFCLFLILCVIFDLSILYALAAGLLVFILYAVKTGHSFLDSLGFALSGIKTAKNILISFVLIGSITALWRESGTIPTIVCYCVKLIHPAIFLLMTFLLNCIISVLTGTAFGTAATMGVICSTMAASLDIPPVLTGGAVLSGVYFGDRCSPISTSALLVANLTNTQILSNIKKMLRSALFPFLITCALYAVIGVLLKKDGELPHLVAIFGADFKLSVITVLPAVVLFALSVFKVDVKLAMAASIVTALPICIFVQDTAIADIPKIMIFGYETANPQVADMLSGGGIISMVKVIAIVCISAAYSGIFKNTDILDVVKKAIHKLAGHTSAYFATLVTSIVSAVIACNQTLTIMLTEQLCNDIEKDKSRLALNLENTAVVIAPLIPWSIAGAVPLASIGAPLLSLVFAFFLYLLPVWNAFVRPKARDRQDSQAS